MISLDFYEFLLFNLIFHFFIFLTIFLILKQFFIFILIGYNQLNTLNTLNTPDIT